MLLFRLNLSTSFGLSCLTARRRCTVPSPADLYYKGMKLRKVLRGGQQLPEA